MCDTTVMKSNIPVMSSLLDQLSLPVGNLFESLNKNIPDVLLITYFLDANFRITRSIDDNVFVYAKV